MTPEMILTMIVLVFAIILFIFEWVRVDVVGIIMMVMLPLIGLVSPKEAFVGLSSNAVCSIIAVIIIGAGLDKTGVMNKVAGPIIKLAGNSEKKVITLISGTVGIISSMMQNIGARRTVSAGCPADCQKNGGAHIPYFDAHGFLRHHRRNHHAGGGQSDHIVERSDGAGR